MSIPSSTVGAATPPPPDVALRKPASAASSLRLGPKIARGGVLLIALSGYAISAAAMVSAPQIARPVVDGEGSGYIAGSLVRAEAPRLQVVAFVPPMMAPADLPERVVPDLPPDPSAREALIAASLSTFPKLDRAVDRVETIRRRVHFQPGNRTDCIPRGLVVILYEIAERFGDVKIHSTYRDPRLNAQVGGATKSMHLKCRAIDFSVGGDRGKVGKYLASHPKIGGYGLYPGSHFHIDDGPKRHW